MPNLNCSFIRHKLISAATLLALTAAGSFASELPSRTPLEIRLTAPAGSRLSHTGDRIQAVVIAPVLVDGVTVVPQGSTLFGSILSVNRLGLGLKHCTASIDMKFDSLQLPGKMAVQVSTRVLDVETAKERVNGSGVIGGIHPVANFSSGVSILISALLMQPAVSVPAVGIKFLIARSPDPEIYLPAGTEMILRTGRAIELPDLQSTVQTVRHLSTGDEDQARQLLTNLPNQQAERGPNQPSDLANVLFLGTESEINRAFHAAGWTGAQGHNAMAVYRMFHSVVQRAGYSMAPMTKLKLNGVTQHSGYQKSLDTFAKRHHIRLWKQEKSDIWLSAASEDLGFAMHKMLVTHASDRNIDNERAKVVNDLAMTGCVESASLLSRRDLRVESEGLQSIVTDGKIAVLRLNDCQNPVNVIPPDHHPIAFHIGQIAGVVARDFARSNPLSVGYSTARMVVSHSNTRESKIARQDVLPSRELLSDRWKRQSVVTNPVALAGGYSAIGGR